MKSSFKILCVFLFTIKVNRERDAADDESISIFFSLNGESFQIEGESFFFVFYEQFLSLKQKMFEK
jgi:hypothetical protein